MNKYHYLLGMLFFLPLVSVADTLEQDFTEISFDELMQIEITSVSKKNEKLSEAAAAVYVVTADEIRRVGATTIPEALRLVPGVDVAQIDPNKWAVSIRGFNGRFANKLLVLIDGRSVYTPTFSGVYWEYFDYLMSDIERIEVIRGPGATLWGTNAVNGIVNIITRDAGANPGGTLSVSAGNEYQGISIRQGGKLSDNVQFRAYAKGKKVDESVDVYGDGQDNGGDFLQTGFRLDVQPNNAQGLIFQGDLYRSDNGQEQNYPTFEFPYEDEIVNSDIETKGGNLDAQWSNLTGLESEVNMKLSYSFYDHQEIKYDSKGYNIDVEIQHQTSPLLNHSVVWGGGYRMSYNNITSTQYFSVDDAVNDSQIWNLFVQDTLDFPEQNMALTLGAKLEDNDYTGSELQPNIRLSWVPNEQFTLWGAISRAVRSPSRAEIEGIISLEANYPALIQVYGNDDFKSEQLDAYELGARWRPLPELSFDVATFYNDYEDLRSSVIGEFDYINYTQILDLENNLEGYSVGAEFLATWQATPNSRYRFGYNYLNIELTDNVEASADVISLIEDRAPEHQVSLWGSFDLTDTVELDLRFYYTSKRAWYSTIDHEIPGYFQGDLRVGWQATPSFSVSLVGRNLLHDQQQEFISESWESASEIERSVFLNGTLRW
jgi:iron complex outermembrane receptor protein